MLCSDYKAFCDSDTQSHTATVRVTLTLPPITYRGEVILLSDQIVTNQPSLLTERMGETDRVSTAETTCRMRLNQRGFNTAD